MLTSWKALDDRLVVRTSPFLSSTRYDQAVVLIRDPLDVFRPPAGLKRGPLEVQLPLSHEGRAGAGAVRVGTWMHRPLSLGHEDGDLNQLQVVYALDFFRVAVAQLACRGLQESHKRLLRPFGPCELRGRKAF